MSDPPLDAPGVRGIIAPARRLDAALPVVLAALLLACAVRYVSRHPLDERSVAVLAGAALLAVVYAARGVVWTRPTWPGVWVTACVVLWAVLTLLAPSFAWTAVPVAFAVLQVLPFPLAVAVVAAMTLVVSLGWARLTDGVDPTVVVGPVGLALLTVLVYRALAREADTRQRLLDELTSAQDDLAAAGHRAGVDAERTRLSREIHDSVGQHLTSISLLLSAAEQDWERRPDAARERVARAAAAAHEGLEEVRHVVRDLAPGTTDTAPGAVAAALERVIADLPPGPAARLAVHGQPFAIAPAVATAVVRTARGALANVVEHADAERIGVTLTYLPDSVRLDVRDNGTGFEADRARARTSGRTGALGSTTRGHGLAGIRSRAADLGGEATIESAPGEGTTVSLWLPSHPAPKAAP